MPLYIRDTKWFPQKLNQIEEILKGSSLDCLDVKSLYTNIPNGTNRAKAVRKLMRNTKETRFDKSSRKLLQFT